jgi:hypothetical protein
MTKSSYATGTPAFNAAATTSCLITASSITWVAAKLIF